ncbi:uncharacterized protein BDFB_014022 [Asbolus verrucosus]|uniref:Uncharacterized protein n=1 Tax=Asbolus verrucosus TaxID=1661398 RepID=A0A482VKE7_ASBVE|nr:uncharacterized protein BDFB_014022 [Asbolus verrucosus]
MHITIRLFLCAAIFGVFAAASDESDPENVESSAESLNDTIPQDLYVIKTVVYEVGILTEAGNDTNLNGTHEQVDVSFYDPALNGSSIDLSKIPLPIQTNVSGVAITGLLPGADLASILLPPGAGGVANPILPKKQVTVTQNISTSNPDTGSVIISNLPKILGLTTKNDSEKSSKDESGGDHENAK